MELTLERKWCKSTYSIGKLYINGVLFCNTCEDKDRNLTSSMSADEIKKIKVQNETAIPKGTYQITLDVVSPKYSNYTKYPWAKEFGGKLPRLTNVPGFDGVLIHVGNSAADSSGCILVGENKAVGKVLNSTATFKKLYSKLKEASSKGEKITITIK